ncbi:MAG: iron-sulfur cluster assembly accessory protein [Verrucomicrobiae bacterium]|nr:iron-sulfur cluster assembly accessory protein [Verrucomicrobiae bacterium]MCP5520678.1 iron-sulfur cluster assembly accessory protein [Verrucomicrobiales bacterium]
MSTINQADPVVTLTESAAEEIRGMLERDPAGAGKGLRLFVEQGGCSGMQYGMEFATAKEGDLPFETQGVTVLVDAGSAAFLRGSVVDFSDSLNDSGFKIVNPNARRSCGCGKSFET